MSKSIISFINDRRDIKTIEQKNINKIPTSDNIQITNGYDKIIRKKLINLLFGLFKIKSYSIKINTEF